MPAEVDASLCSGGRLGWAASGTRRQLLSGLNAVMPAAMRAVFGPRSCGRAFPDLERECERGFGGLERTEAERVLTGWARCRRRARASAATVSCRRALLLAMSADLRDQAQGNSSEERWIVEAIRRVLHPASL